MPKMRFTCPPSSALALALLAGAVSAQTAAPASTVPAPAPAPVAAQAVTMARHAGVLKAVQGKVQLARTDGKLQAAQSGDLVDATDRVVTGSRSGASLVLRDGTVLVIGPDSRVDLRQFSFDATTQDGGMVLSLLRGSMRMISGLIGKTSPEAVQIETQTATIGIRGTDFIVSADGGR